MCGGNVCVRVCGVGVHVAGGLGMPPLHRYPRGRRPGPTAPAALPPTHAHTRMHTPPAHPHPHTPTHTHTCRAGLLPHQLRAQPPRHPPSPHSLQACCHIINTLYGFNAMEVQEAFVKVAEQASGSGSGLFCF